LRQHFSLDTGILLVAVVLSLPVMVIAGFLLVPATEVWQHLADTVLTDYISNSLLLMLGVSIGTIALGVSSAWLTAMCQFPGRKIFEWAMLLPLAMPAYIIAYTYTGMLDFSGPVQTFIRSITGWGYGDYWFPEVRSLEGAAVMLSLVLYPYVYLLTRAAFLNQSLCVLDVSRTLGNGTWATFFRVALPLARPAIVAGLTLALMETLADFGTVEYFGVQTFTTGIFRTWYGLDDVAAAAQLAGVLLLFVFTLIIIERYQRKQARYHHTSQRHQALKLIELKGINAWLAFTFCFGLLLLGFLLPVGQLLSWVLTISDEVFDSRYWRLVEHSLTLAFITALLALCVALFLGYGRRISPNKVTKGAVNVAGMGYAIPGAVIAVGVMIPFSMFDNWLDAWLTQHVGISSGLLLSGSIAGLVFAYLVRFLSVSLQTVESGLIRVRYSMDEAAQSMGLTSLQTMRRVHMPMLTGSLLTALLLVFVDVLKELPATLILRPFNFNTLAVRAYELASDERLADAAPAALTIVAVGIIPVILLSYSITRSRHEHTA
jgi:iron(III) transport system permease protein